MYVCFSNSIWGQTRHVPCLNVTYTSMQSMIDTIYIGMAQTWIHLHTDRAILNRVSQTPYPLINMHIHCTQRKDSLSHIITRTRMYMIYACLYVCV